MPDERSRQLERAAVTGDTSARVARLRDMQRRGQISETRIDVAAFCGSEVAQRVMGWAWYQAGGAGDRGAPPLQPSKGLDDGSPDRAQDLLSLFVAVTWRKVQGYGGRLEIMARAGVAAARAVLEAWSPVAGFEWTGPVTAPMALIEEAEAWLACPCEEHEVGFSNEDAPIASNMVATDEAWWLAVRTLLLYAEGKIHEEAGAGPEGALTYLVQSGSRIVAPETIRKAICAALVAWALEDLA